MLGWQIWAAVLVASAEPGEVSWDTMAAGAKAAAPLFPSRVRWERAPGSHAVDLLEALPGSRVLVGHLNVALEGIPVPAAIEAWDARSGEPLWEIDRPWLEGAVWEVVHPEPLVVAGRSPNGSVLLSVDLATGEALWSTSTEHDLVQVAGQALVVWRRGHLEALSMLSGESLWKVPMGLPSEVHTDGGAILAESPEAVVSVDAGWGAEDWRVPGRWSVGPTADGQHRAIYNEEELRWVDAFGQGLWSWSAAGEPDTQIATATGAEGKAVVVVSDPEADRVLIVDEGQVIGTVALNGRLASELLPIGGVFAVTTEDELVAFSPIDGAIAYRSDLPEPFLGWGPNDRPELAQGQLDVLREYDDQIVVIRERAGLVTYDAAHFGAGERKWVQPFASVGADPLTVGGRFAALSEAMGASMDSASADAEGAIARRRMEFEAARNRAEAPLQGRYFLRPFRRPASDGTGIHGLSVIDMATGLRADVAYGPLFEPVVHLGVDIPAVAVDGPNGQVLVASTAPEPNTWLRTNLGGATVPGSSVRAIAIGDLQFGETSPKLAAIDEAYPPLAQDVVSAAPKPKPSPTSPPDAVLSSAGGASADVCVEQGIVEADRHDVIEACLDRGVDLVSPLPTKRHALLEAVDRNRLETVRLLLDAGADPNTVGLLDPRPPLERATDPDLAVLIASRGGEERSAGDKKRALKDLMQLSGLRKPNGAWCFHHGSRGRGDVIDACLAKRNSGILTHVDPEQGHLVHVAAREGRVGHVRQLLDAGANPNIADAEGKTPLARLDELDELDAGQKKAARLLELAGGI